MKSIESPEFTAAFLMAPITSVFDTNFTIRQKIVEINMRSFFFLF